MASPTGSLGDGRQLVSFGVSDDRRRRSLLQPDGKIVLAGVGAAAGRRLRGREADVGRGARHDVQWRREDEPDVRRAGRGGRREFATGVALQPDGKFVVVGYSDAGSGLGTNDFAIARLNTNGSQDTSFANGGELLIDFGGDDRAYGVAIDPATGKAVVVGATTRGDNAGGRPPGPRLRDRRTPTLPSLSISDVSVQEGHAGTVNAVFTVTLSSASAVAGVRAGVHVEWLCVAAGRLHRREQRRDLPAGRDDADRDRARDRRCRVRVDRELRGHPQRRERRDDRRRIWLGLIRDDDLAMTITSPTSALAFTAAQGLVTIGGAAGDSLVGGIQDVTWVNAPAAAASATGTTTWTAAIPLTVGANAGHGHGP